MEQISPGSVLQRIFMNSELHLRNTKCFKDQSRKKDSKASEQWGLVPQRGCEAASGRGTWPSLRPQKRPSSLLWGSEGFSCLDYLQASGNNETEMTMHFCEPQCLGFLQKTRQNKARAFLWKQLKITTLANIKGCIPLWVEASTTTKCCVFHREKCSE